MTLEDMKAKYEKIVIWGAGKTFVRACTDDLDIAYIVDADKNKRGTYSKGIKVEAPEKLLEEKMDNVCIIIFSIYWKEIIVQINAMKITADVVLPSMIVPSQFFREEKPYKTSFALFAEDAIISGIAERYNISIKHYIDIGANHPMYGNSTFLFYLKGCSGILVEPNRSYSDRIKQYRPRDTVWNVGIAGKGTKCEGTYYEVEGFDTRNTFSEETAEYYRQRGFNVHTKMVDLMDLESLLEQYGERVDYINIDVEGMEYDILKEFDFRKHDIAVFNIEKGNDLIKELMIANNYYLVAETPSNWIFFQNGKVKEIL